MASGPLAGKWALILGASSGFGAATSRELARHGMNIIGVHLDRRAARAAVEELVKDIEAQKAKALFFNVNAADAAKREEVLGAVQEKIGGGEVTVLMHSLAFGTLKPYWTEDAKARLNKDQMEMTLDVMAHSLVYWTQDLIARGLMGKGGRIFAMTSSRWNPTSGSFPWSWRRLASAPIRSAPA